LKEKGFDEKCFQYWHEKDNELVHSRSPCPIRNITNPCFFGPAAPTLQMAMKWLRDVHSCYITTYWEFKNYNENGNPVFKDIIWSYNISIPKYNSARNGDGDYFDMDSEKEDYTTSEEACEAAIKYCLENLI